MKFYWILCFSCLFFIGDATASGNGNGQSAKEETREEPLPNPVNLAPSWWNYFENSSGTLGSQADNFTKELNQLVGSIENPDQKKLAEGRVSEIRSYLDSLLILEKQKKPAPSLSWIPKQSYTLEDYLGISENKRELEQQISSASLEINRYRYNIQEIQQTLSNKYAMYLNSDGKGADKLLKGLEVISLKTRLMYLQKMTANLNLQQSDARQLAERYQAELKLIPGRIHVAVAKQKLEKDKEQYMDEYVSAHNAFLEVEKSVAETAEDEKNSPSQMINQKLTNTLLKAIIARAEFEFADAVLKLKKTEDLSEQLSYENDILPIKTFVNDSKEKLATWKQTVSSEFERLSMSQTIKKENEGYKDQLNMALENRMLLNTLSEKLGKIQSVLALIDLNSIQEESFWSKVSYYFHTVWIDTSEAFAKRASFSLFEIGGIPVTAFGVIKAILIIIITIWLSKIVQKSILRLSKRKGRASESTYYSFARVVHYLVVFLGILIALGSLGLNFNSIALILGALGVGIGFGLQGIVNNFICGLTILFERNIKVGDLLELQSGHFGRVTEVNIQNTTVHTWDGLDVLVPNASIVGKQVVNWTKQDPYLRLHIPFIIAYGTDQDKVSDVVCEAAKQVPTTLTRAQGMKDPEVWLTGFGESSLNFELVVWVNILQTAGRSSLRACYLTEIEKALKANQITIPFPQRDLHLRSLPLGKERITFETADTDEE